MGIEDPDADVAEQMRSSDDLEYDTDDPSGEGGLPAEADPADVADQRLVVPQDIDEP